MGQLDKVYDVTEWLDVSFPLACRYSFLMYSSTDRMLYRNIPVSIMSCRER